jgi:ADP-ribosylglycohydrolase
MNVIPKVSKTDSYGEKTYAGVVGKLIGVYLGRAVEGWSYEAIRKTFGEIDYYVNEHVKWPLIVPDDDISGTFLFWRALEDNGYPVDLPAKAIGDTWLNYIIEDRTVLWWGGLGRSTEHTAYLRLKAGIHAPRSGSADLNSRAMAEAIGSEIFIDTWAMANPGNPDRAADMARKAASVSHDNLAIDAAVLLAAMEAAAYDESDIDKLIDIGLNYSRDDYLNRVIGEVREQCAKANHWRDVRDWLEANHSYRHYPGPCPMMPNHALLIASFILGGDDVQEGLKIAVSSGWDTDCNAGNLACLNGIRLGLSAFDQGPDFRGPVADRLYLVGADGGECLTDAVIETRNLRRAAAALNGESFSPPPERFAFEYRGSVQGWELCPLHEGPQSIKAIGNLNAISDDNGLLLSYGALAKGVTGSVSVPTFIDPKPRAKADTSYFEVLASPSIYESQTVRAKVRSLGPDAPDLRFFIIHYDGDGNLVKLPGKPMNLGKSDTELTWQVPSTGGLPIHRIGIELSASRRMSGQVALLSLDWAGAPEHFCMGGALELSPNMSPFDTTTYWLKSFVSSAVHFRPDVDTTFALSHAEANGVATTGTRDWVNYTVSARFTMDLHERAGLVARARGHRRYYAALLSGRDTALIVCRKDETEVTLAEVPFTYDENQKLQLALTVKGDALTFAIDGKTVATARDVSYASGGAGMVVDRGTIPVRGFEVRAV